MRLQLLGHRSDGHHGAGVPEQVGEDQEPGSGLQAGLELLQNHSLKVPLGGALAELQYRQGGQGQVVAAGQFLAGRHDAWVLTVTDQQLIALLPGQAPEGQDTSTGDVLGEGNAMGADPTPARQAPAQATGFLLDEGPDIGCEGPQLLNREPTGCDGLQRWGGQRPLTAVVEIGLVGQCWTEIPVSTGVCVGRGVGNSGQNCQSHLQGTSVLRASASCACRRRSDRLLGRMEERTTQDPHQRHKLVRRLSLACTLAEASHRRLQQPEGLRFSTESEGTSCNRSLLAPDL